ncbi:unnamed protein product [Timema podura]|uniref:Uncharacterized protein n=1 Tax=Timema podura TaxID=61482 RepID=A0ABN7NYT1_TIMPD|nr:unnamed protein product [Timema podura]
MSTMDHCDISIVKEENFELIIKTEPQNNNEFYICGESQIKTEEESNSAGDINDTINYGAHCVHTSNVNMKSPWDDFLPIKEQIKFIVRFPDTKNALFFTDYSDQARTRSIYFVK